MSIAFACACGKKLVVADDMAGQRLRCPRCEKSIAVPEVLDEYREEDDPAAKAKLPEARKARAKPPEPRSVLARVLVRSLILLLIAGATGTTTYFVAVGVSSGGGGLLGTPIPEDLKFIPNEARWFATVRVADIYAHPAVYNDIKERFEKRVASVKLDPTQVERWTKVNMTGPPTGRGGNDAYEWEIVATKEPYDEAAVRTKYLGPAAQAVSGPRTYHTTTAGAGEWARRCIYFHNKNVFVIAGREVSLMAALRADGSDLFRTPVGDLLKQTTKDAVFVAAKQGWDFAYLGATNVALEYSVVTRAGDRGQARFTSAFENGITQAEADARLEKTRKAIIGNLQRSLLLQMALPRATASVSGKFGVVTFNEDFGTLMAIAGSHEIFRE